jgi:hypothetical protein
MRNTGSCAVKYVKPDDICWRARDNTAPIWSGVEQFERNYEKETSTR